MTAAGFFSIELLEAGAAEMIAAIRSLGLGVGEHLTLFDYSEIKVVPGPVLERFGHYLTSPEMKSVQARRVAFVCKSALVGLQIDRILRDNMRVFTDRQAATTWLLSDQDRSRTISQPTAASG